jgi:hypothetical protein
LGVLFWANWGGLGGNENQRKQHQKLEEIDDGDGWVGWYIYRDAYTCEVIQCNAIEVSSAHLGLCDYVVDEEGISGHGGSGAFWLGMESDILYLALVV